LGADGANEDARKASRDIAPVTHVLQGRCVRNLQESMSSPGNYPNAIIAEKDGGTMSSLVIAEPVSGATIPNSQGWIQVVKSF
jgi:hypothetical protein